MKDDVSRESIGVDSVAQLARQVIEPVDAGFGIVESGSGLGSGGGLGSGRSVLVASTVVHAAGPAAVVLNSIAAGFRLRRGTHGDLPEVNLLLKTLEYASNESLAPCYHSRVRVCAIMIAEWRKLTFES